MFFNDTMAVEGEKKCAKAHSHFIKVLYPQDMKILQFSLQSPPLEKNALQPTAGTTLILGENTFYLTLMNLKDYL